MADDLGLDAIEGALRGRFGRPLRILDEIDSTSEEAWRWVDQHAPEGAVVVADHQTAGRGRRGRTWAAAPGTALLFSIVLRPVLLGDEITLLTTAVGVACIDAIRRVSNVPVRLKWPNDVVCRSRKLTGILVETRGRGDAGAVVAGVGINVRTSQEDFPPQLRDAATSIAIESPDEVPARAKLLGECLAGLEPLYAGLRSQRTRREIVRKATRYSDSLGRSVSVRYPDGTSIVGVAAAIAGSGALVLSVEGRRVEVSAGEIENVRST